jgi:hypothetical protein
MHFVKLDLGQELFFPGMTIFHCEVFLGLMKPQLAVLFLPLQQTGIICLRIYPLHRAFCSFLWSNCPPHFRVDFLCICAENIVLVWPSSYLNLLHNVSNFLLILSNVYTHCLQETICTSLSPFETLIAKAIMSSNVRIWWCKLTFITQIYVWLLSTISSAPEWKHLPRNANMVGLLFTVVLGLLGLGYSILGLF